MQAQDESIFDENTHYYCVCDTTLLSNTHMDYVCHRHAIRPEDVTKEDYMVYLDASINIIPTPITLPSVPATSAP